MELNASPNNANQLARHRLLATAWVPFLVVCCIVSGLKLWQNHRYWVQRQRGFEAVDQFQRDFKTDFKDTSDLLRSRFAKPGRETWTLSELEAELPGGAPLQLEDAADKAGRRAAYWTHLRSGHVWRLEFEGNRVAGWSSTGSSSQKAPPTVPDFPRDAGEGARRLIANYARPLWLCLLVAWVVARRHRTPLGHSLLAVTIMGVCSDLANPHYSLHDAFSNDALGVSMLALEFTIAILAASSAAGREFVARWLLPRRRFSLRWMLAVTALVAVLVSFRENGLVVGEFLAAGAGFYWVSLRLFGRQVQRP